MKRALLTLGAAVLVLAGAEAWLSARNARARADAVRIGTLFTPAEADELRKQPALRIELPGERHAYGRVQGQWRCLSLHGAPADGRGLQELIDGILRAEGLQYSREVDEAPRYGINTPETIRVSIQGPRAQQDPGGDVRATLELGRSLPDGSGCFVRRRGTRAVWSIAGDLRPALTRRVAPGLPPLLQAGALPPAWLEEGGGIVRITAQHGAASWALVRRDRAMAAAQAGPGNLPWEWLLERDGTSTVIDDQTGQGYAAFLASLPYADVLDPQQRFQRIPAPRAVLVLESRAGGRLRLEFGPADVGARSALWVAETDTLYAVEADAFALAVPAPERFTATPGEGPDPWSAYLAGEGRR